MPRYIDADKLIAERTIFMQDEEAFYESVVLVSDIKLAPTADVAEVKHGEWVWDKRFSDYTCNLCGNWDLKTPNYCPNCGAKMDGKGDSE